MGSKNVNNLNFSSSSTIQTLWTTMGFGLYHQLLKNKTRTRCVCSDVGPKLTCLLKFTFSSLSNTLIWERRKNIPKGRNLNILSLKFYSELHILKFMVFQMCQHNFSTFCCLNYETLDRGSITVQQSSLTLANTFGQNNHINEGPALLN